MVDMSQLVQGLTSFLAPLMPYLVTAGQKVAEGVGDATWEKAQEIWRKLHPKVAAKPAAQEAVQDVAANPDNADARAALRLQLTKLLTDDPALVNELQLLLTQAQATGLTQTVSGTGNIVAGRDMTGNTNITGGSQGFVQPGWSVGSVHQTQRDLPITEHTEDPKQK